MSTEFKHEIPQSLYFLEEVPDYDITQFVEERMSREELDLFYEFSIVFNEAYSINRDNDQILNDIFELIPHTKEAVDKYITLYQSFSGRDM